jgi:hypothetical protein
MSVFVMRAESFTVTNAISFRGSDDCLTDLHLEASGFCLIHADNPLSRTQGVFVNPHVRVGYGQKAYNAVDSGDDTDSYPKFAGIYKGLRSNGLARRFTSLVFKELAVDRQHNAVD